MSSSTSDAGIPLLTEIIPGPAPAETRRPAPPAVKEEGVALAPRAANVLDEDEWNRLEREIRERVLQQIIERVDLVLEQRVRDSLADVLQTAVEGLASDIRSGLHVSIRDAVTRAVTQEIARLKSEE